MLRLIFLESLRIAAIGFAIGRSRLQWRLLRSQLYQLDSFDLATFAAACAISLDVTIGAVSEHCRRSTRPAHNTLTDMATEVWSAATGRTQPYMQLPIFLFRNFCKGDY